jgi:hypothetical protein
MVQIKEQQGLPSAAGQFTDAGDKKVMNTISRISLVWPDNVRVVSQCWPVCYPREQVVTSDGPGKRDSPASRPVAG